MKACRNYYCSDDNIKSLDNLVEQGLMTRRNYPPMSGDNPQIYYVTKEGFKFLSDLTGMEITEME